MKNPFVTNGYAGSEHFCDRILNVLYSRTETGKKGDEGGKEVKAEGAAGVSPLPHAQKTALQQRR